MDNKRIVVALDVPEGPAALALAARLDPALCRVKVGKELFVSAGPAVVESLQRAGFEVFLDLKFHDIPNTVAAACKAAARLGVWMMNVHASGGAAMMQAAREAVPAGAKAPLLIGVTVLTSLKDAELAAIGWSGSAADNVMRLARLAHASGLDGVVCSAREASVLREIVGPGFVSVTPGIRPAGGEAGDQARVVTPEDAVRAGAHYLVVGRPVTQAADPAASLRAIAASIEKAGNAA
ncbi:MAG: orotidine-5'-phosphate decarboxylase [Betaproteobacteria bacterium]|nr:orotidine-5'-phosphate decarboxylase [Betaproteobacteria bacterium]